MPEVSVNVRCSNGQKFTTQVDLVATVLVFKQKIAEEAGVAPELQRLIFKGRVLNEDQNTLASYTVEANSTVHLVRSQGRPAAAPAPAASTAGTSPFGAPGAEGVGAGRAGANPYAEMMGGMGGGMDIGRMRQQLMSNPEMVASIMNSPMMAGMLNNPETLRNMLFNNPQMQAVMENNPQIRHILSDPAVLRQYVDMALNPDAMNQARRSNDLQMSQLERSPEGFNALRRLYADVQEPLMQASDNMANNGGGAPVANQNAAAPAANPSAGPNTSALPNPWAPATAAGAPAAGLGAGANPWAGLGGAGGGAGMPGMGAGMPGMGAGMGAGMPGMPGMEGQMDPAMMSEFMRNPAIQQRMNELVDDPAFMDTVISSNPALQRAIESNPGMREQMPQFFRGMTDPQNLQALAQMQSSMQQLQRAGMLPPGGGGMPGMPGMPVADGGGLGPGLAGLGNFGNLNLGAGTRATSPAAGGLDFSQLLGGGGGLGAGANPWGVPPPAPSSSTSSTNAPSATPAPAVAPTPPAAAAANPEETYAAQLNQMNDMGFTDRAACVRALVLSQGNVNAAVERMLGGGV